MNILLSGASGLVGKFLGDSLAEMGNSVYRLQRHDPAADWYWNIEEDYIKWPSAHEIDVVIHLAGAGIAEKRWSVQRKKEIYDSRVLGTRTLAKAILAQKHKPELFIGASAIGYYGSFIAGQQEKIIDEQSLPASDFLAQVCIDWEGESKALQKAGLRVVNMRTGVVLSSEGGMLRRLLLPFRLGLGGRVGSGEQDMSWISLNDMIRAILFILEHKAIQGAVNFCSPNSVSNLEFTKELAKALRRPAFFPLPSFVAKVVFGEMAESLLLQGVRVKPAVLLEQGFHFADESLAEALKGMRL